MLEKNCLGIKKMHKNCGKFRMVTYFNKQSKKKKFFACTLTPYNHS